MIQRSSLYRLDPPGLMVQAGVYTFLGEFGRLAAHLPLDQTLRALAHRHQSMRFALPSVMYTSAPTIATAAVSVKVAE